MNALDGIIDLSTTDAGSIQRSLPPAVRLVISPQSYTTMRPHRAPRPGDGRGSVRTCTSRLMDPGESASAHTACSKPAGQSTER